MRQVGVVDASVDMVDGPADTSAPLDACEPLDCNPPEDAAQQLADADAEGEGHDAGTLEDAEMGQSPAPTRWLAFLTDVAKRGKGRLWLQALDSGDTPPVELSSQLTPDAWVSEWELAPDGQHVAYRARTELGGNRLFVATLPSDKLAEPNVVALSEATVAPDGVSSMVWSPGGSKIAFVTRQGGQAQLFVASSPFRAQAARRVGVAGQVRAEAAAVAWAGEERLVFADRSRVYYTQADELTPEVHSLVEGGERPWALRESVSGDHTFGAQPVSQDAAHHYRIAVPDGSAAYLGFGRELVRGVGDEVTATAGPLGSELQLVDVAHGRSTPVHARMLAHYSQTPMADGARRRPVRHLVTSGDTGRRLEVWSLAQGAFRARTASLSPTDAEIYGFDMSNGGERLLAWTRRALFDIALAGDDLPLAPRQLSLPTFAAEVRIRGASLAGDGRGVLVWAEQGSPGSARTDLFLIPEPGAEAQPLHVQAGARRTWAPRPRALPSWAPDSQRIAFVTGGAGEPSELTVVDTMTGRTINLGRGSCEASPGPLGGVGGPGQLCSGVLEYAFAPAPRPCAAGSCGPEPRHPCSDALCQAQARLPLRSATPPAQLTDRREQMYLFLDAAEPELPRAELPDPAHYMLEGCWPVPRSEPLCLDGPLSWLEDPFLEKYWRIMVHSLRVLADPLARYRYTGEPAYRDVLLVALDSFFRHMADAPASWLWDKHTTAFRGMMLTSLHDKLAAVGSLDPVLADQMEAHLQEIGAFLMLPENFEEDQNHGVTEAGALLLVAENFPTLVGASDWSALGRERLSQLMRDIVGADGVSSEQSVFYHFYNLNFFWQIASWAHAQNVQLDGTFGQRLDGMVRYASLVVQPNLLLPMLDVSLLQDLSTYQQAVYDDLELTYPQLRYVRSQGSLGQRPDESERYVLFPDAGRAILRSSFGSAADFPQHAQAIFDVGRWNTANSQLDALNVHLYAAGRTLLTDSASLQKKRPTPRLLTMTAHPRTTRWLLMAKVSSREAHVPDCLHTGSTGAINQGGTSSIPEYDTSAACCSSAIMRWSWSTDSPLASNIRTSRPGTSCPPRAWPWRVRRPGSAIQAGGR